MLAMLFQFNRDQGLLSPLGFGRVQDRDDPVDDSGFMQSAHPPETGRRREANLFSECRIGARGILLQKVEQFLVDLVHGPASTRNGSCNIIAQARNI